VKSVSSLAGYEILTEGTGSNAGTCLINLRIGTIESNVEIMAELEEKSKSIPGANIDFSNRQRYLVMELPEDLNFVY
jgi:HAE1 family hydrophobic/amphiphilic exporter-1